MKRLIDFLKGKKTYVVAVIIAVVNLAVAFGYISPDHLTQINIVLGALGLGAVRDAIGNK